MSTIRHQLKQGLDRARASRYSHAQDAAARRQRRAVENVDRVRATGRQYIGRPASRTSASAATSSIRKPDASPGPPTWPGLRHV